MEIGGTDKIIAINPSMPILDTVIGIIRNFWTELVYKDHDDNIKPEYRTSIYDPNLVLGFFVYKDAECEKSWSNDGLTDDNKNTMIYVLHTSGEPELTIVFDCMNEESIEILEALKNGFQRNG